MRVLIISLLLISASVFPQEIPLVNSLYEKADNNTKSRNSFKRERWFYEQRMYPFSTFPENAYRKAYEQKTALRNSAGFYYKENGGWFSIGPTPGYYFDYGNISSRIAAVKFDPQNPSTIYIGAACGGVWKSTNLGQSWEPKTDFEVSLSSGALAIDPYDPNVIYYGTGEATYSIVSYYGRGILKSSDGGETWINYTQGLPQNTYFNRLAIRPSNTQHLLAATGPAGLFRSTNGGISWHNLINSRIDDVVFTAGGDTVYCIGQTSGLKISYDGGQTFTVTASGISETGTRNHLGVCRNAPIVIYAAGYRNDSLFVYKSVNGGLNFTRIAQNTNFIALQGWYNFYVYVHPENPQIAFIGLIDIYRTTNGGADFQNITNGYADGNVHVDQHNLDFHPTDPSKMLCVNDGGIWYSSNGGNNWLNLNSSLTLTQFYRISADPSNPSNILGGTQDNGMQWTLGSLNWRATFGGDGGEACFQPHNPEIVVAEIQLNGVRRSTNGGRSWTGSGAGLFGNPAWIAPITAHPDSGNIFFTGRSNLFKSTTYGANWTAISDWPNVVIREHEISQSNPFVMYISSASTLYKSTNGGYTFANTTNGLPDRIITSIRIHPDSSNTVMVTMSGFGTDKIYKSSNGGLNWLSVSGNLPDSPVNDALFYYPNFATGGIIAATDVGVFISSNYGGTWTELSEGLPNTVAMHLDYHKASGRLRIGTHGRGVWEFNGPLIGLSRTGIASAERYYLMQNYPNPFNPATKIRFGIKERSESSLRIYDILGKERAVIVNGLLDAGNYESVFDGSSLPSGIYFYTLETAAYRETRKMMLLK